MNHVRRFLTACLLTAAVLPVAASAEPPPMFLLKWGSYGKEPGQFRRPQTVTTDAAGYVYVADTFNGRIQKFDTQGRLVALWDAGGGRPEGVAAGPGGVVYVSSDDAVYKYTDRGSFILRWGTRCEEQPLPIPCPPGQFMHARGLAVDAQGMVYVADMGNRRVQKFDADGNFLTMWGSYGSADGQFRGPTDVAVDGAGNVFVGDAGNNRIQKFDSQGAFILKWGSYGSGDGQFRDGVIGLACDPSGNVYASGDVLCRIQKFDGTGTFSCKWGTQGSADGQFLEPTDVAVSANREVYVCDTDNHRIQKFGWTCAPTPVGTNVEVSLPGIGITLTFDDVVQEGETCVGTTGGQPKPPSGFYRGKCLPDYQLWTSAHYLGTAEVCVTFSDKCFPHPPQLELFQLVDGAWVNHPSSVIRVDKTTWQLCATMADLDTIAFFDPYPPYGTVQGQISADCPAPGTPLAGVTIDVYGVGRPDLVASGVSGLDGSYQVADLWWGDYRVVVVPPFGHSFAVPETLVFVPQGQWADAPFAATCLTIPPRPKSMGYWKHQVGSNLSGKGQPQVGSTTVCGYLDQIVAHFNSNTLNPVVIYQEPSWGDCRTKLEVAAGLLNLQGSVEMIDRARQQLLSLLLNVAAEYLSLTEVISRDGATVSQAITWCDNVIDDPAGDYEMAKTIADDINNGRMVAAGKIPLTTPQIAYRMRDIGGTPGAVVVRPNPGHGVVAIHYALPSRGGPVVLEIYSVAGRKVHTLVNGAQPGGEHTARWFGTDDRGLPVEPGVYFYRARIAGHVTSGRFVMLP
jgi:DNA-binding beta-propeller fold protein YncE